jgi:ankyrin repeat protein
MTTSQSSISALAPGSDEPGPALVAAARAGDLAAVRALLDVAPSAVAYRDADGESALVAAAFRGHRAVAELLAQYASRHATLDVWEAALVGDVPRLYALCAADRERARARRHDGWTPLHLAGFYGHPDAAAALLELGAEPSALGDNALANTPLHAALAISGDGRVVELLVARGADVNARAAGGYTPLHLAASRGHAMAVELLLARGASPGARTDDGRSPADLATERGHADGARRLGASPGAPLGAPAPREAGGTGAAAGH